MIRNFFFLVIVAGFSINSVADKQQYPLASGGASAFQILVAPDALPAVAYAAQELQQWLEKMTGVALPIVHEGNPAEKPMIVVGRHPNAPVIDKKERGAEDYLIKTEGPSLYIDGGSPRGVLYGVYGLLDDHLGCRWFTPEVTHIPGRPELILDAIHEEKSPALEYREPFVRECFDGDWAARNRMNSQTATLTEKHGGKVTYQGFVHTFEALVPVEQYFDEHPEYFALVGGKRIRERTQLCCTNEDVVNIVTKRVLEWVEQHPEALVYSVSQNDWYNYCECDKCAALAEAEGGAQIAPVLQMVNHVARAVAEKNPEKLIDTLAYQWTRKAPKKMRPEPNVVVRLCSIECCFSHPFDTCDSPLNTEFVKDVKAWSKQCDRLWVWDYTTSFAGYLVPFPNLRVRAENIRFFVKHNVRGIFEQDVYNTTGGEFAGLSGYLGAKLLWNPDYDPKQAIDEYMEAVYGAGAPFIKQYFDLLHDKMEKENLHLNIWVTADAEYLTEELMQEADALFAKAEQAVADDEAVLNRVRIGRMSTDYILIEQARRDADTLGAVDHQNFTIKPRPDLAQRIRRFIAAADLVGLTELREQGHPYSNYKATLEQLLAETPITVHAPSTPEAYVQGLRYSYFEGARESVIGMSELEPLRQGRVENVGLEGIGETAEAFSLIFRGYIRVQQPGVYTFHLGSNDGSALYIHGQKVVDNDAHHKMTTISGSVGLEVGLHPFAVRYFQVGGEKGLELRYQGPNAEKSAVPSEMFFSDLAEQVIADTEM